MRACAASVFAASFLLSCEIFGQSVTATTPGGCSSAIASGNGNVVTIHCAGISTTKADQIIKLMNRILTERLDVAQINSKLDELETAMGSINDQLNPLRKAPREAQELLNEGQNISTECAMFASDWTSQGSTQLVSNMNTLRALSLEPNPTSIGANDEQQIQEFQRSLGPRITSLIVRLRPALPADTSYPDPASVKTARDVSDIESRLSELHRDYIVVQRSEGRPIDPKLELEIDRVGDECLKLYQGWGASAYRARIENYQKGQRDIASASNNLDAKEMSRYRDTLEPRLTAWKSKVLAAMPGTPSDLDYGAVSDSGHLMAVCRNVTSLTTSYRNKLLKNYPAK
jgi:hypothetical protein